MRMRRKQGHNEIDKISASFTPDAVRINVYSKNNQEVDPSSINQTSTNCNDMLVRLEAHFNCNQEINSDKEDGLQ